MHCTVHASPAAARRIKPKGYSENPKKPRKRKIKIKIKTKSIGRRILYYPTLKQNGRILPFLSLLFILKAFD